MPTPDSILRADPATLTMSYRPRVVYTPAGGGVAVTLDFRLPCKWVPSTLIIGGGSIFDAGGRERFERRREYQVTVTFQFPEADHDAFMAFAEAAQATGAPFTFRLDQRDATREYQMTWESPGLNQKIEPSRVSGTSRVYEHVVVLASTGTVRVSPRFYAADGPAPVAPTITLTSATPVSIAVGATHQVTVTTTGTPAPTVSYSSSAPAIATVDAATGLVTAVAAGTANIVATAQNSAGTATATTALTVTAASALVLEHPFDGPDSATGVPNFVGGQVPSYPGGGVVGITANQGYVVSIGAGRAYGVVVGASSPATANVKLAVSVIAPGRSFTLVTRQSADGSDNFIGVELYDNVMYVLKRVAGTTTVLASGAVTNAPVTAPDAVSRTMTFESNGSVHTATYDGVTVTATDAFNSTATTHGVGGGATGTATTFNNFTATPL